MIINDYARQLTPEEIAGGAHRQFVGGLWDEMGALQHAFLVAQGLRPGHRLADIGCGALRGGVHFIRYLVQGGYFGLDSNASLLEAGRRELAAAGLEGKRPSLLVSERFELGRFGVRFDYAIAVSVFTHLPMNHIIRCLTEAGRALQPGARFYATFFEAPADAYLEPLAHAPGDVVTYFDMDPYHYSPAEIAHLAHEAGVVAERIGEWGHPRDQRMWSFRSGGAR
jgi:cyclopropane fatty-acyl-phospholipid synthase-like methyltransferase